MHHEYLVDGEMEVLVALVRSIAAETMLEIGCRDGRTAKVLLKNVPTLQRYIGIDVPISYQPRLAHQRNEMVHNPGWAAADDPRFDLIIRDRGSLDVLPHDVPPCDVVFIDGDHSEDTVQSDTILAVAVVKRPGLIIWHDYNDSPDVEVTKVIDRLHGSGLPVSIIDGTWLAICRI